MGVSRDKTVPTERLLEVAKLLVKNDGTCDGVKCRECICAYKAGEFYACQGWCDEEVVRMAKAFIKEEQ